MVRISDARMSGTAYGTCVLHVAPESFVGGPLAFVRDGDLIELNVPERRLTLQVSEAELAERRVGWTAPAVQYPRGYGKLHAQHVLQADQGCDFDFPAGGGGDPGTRDPLTTITKVRRSVREGAKRREGEPRDGWRYRRTVSSRG